jgi:predicted porin
MKKIVLATILSVASITASAQVTLYGNLRGLVDNTKVGNQSETSMVSDLSHFGIRANEKLGKGLSARAVVETSIASTDPVSGGDTKLGDRQSTIGLTNRVGSVDIGRAFNSYFLAITNNDAFGTFYGSVAGDVHNVRTVRSGDAVFVNVKVGPANLALDRTFNSAVETTTGSVSGSLGPVTATVAQFKSGSDTSSVFAAQTKMAGAHMFASMSESKTNNVTTKGALVGVALPVDRATLKASYGQKTGDVSAFSVGADYALSKRTAIVVAYRNVDAPVKVEQIGLGLAHKF